MVDSASRNAGGLYESVRRLAQSIRSNHDGTTVFTLEDEHTAEDAKGWEPLELKCFPPKLVRLWGYSPLLVDALLDANLDLLVTHGLWKYTSMAALQWHQQTGRPYIIHPHGMLDPWAVGNSKLKKRIVSWLYENTHLRKAACIRALCQSEADAIRAYGLSNPICIIPNGIDLPDPEIVYDAPWKHPEPGRKVLLYLGRLHHKKNLVPLLHAWSAVQRDNTAAREWFLEIAGWDQLGYEHELQSLASGLGITSSVQFLGPMFKDAKAAAYQNADAFVLPSLSEGLPMVVLEAWAFAKPVVMTPECNLPEGFAAGAAIRTGHHAEDISESLSVLMTMPDTDRKLMGERGRRLVEDRFTWDHLGKQMMAVNEWVARGGPKPECVIQ